jgi:ribonuclease HI
MTAFRLYTDGSCPAPGAADGWAWILVSDDVMDSGSGGILAPSNHQVAEVTAAIEGVTYLFASGVHEAELLSDSRYLVGGMSSTGCIGCTGWAHTAAQREWRSNAASPSRIRDLWERLLELDGSLVVTWRHVRGHRPKKDTSDDARYNRAVDAAVYCSPSPHFART